MTTSTRNQQIVAARIRSAADSLEMAFAELDGAQHDTNTAPDVHIADLITDALELGLEPEQMVWNLRLMADAVADTGRFDLED